MVVGKVLSFVFIEGRRDAASAIRLTPPTSHSDARPIHDAIAIIILLLAISVLLVPCDVRGRLAWVDKKKMMK